MGIAGSPDAGSPTARHAITGQEEVDSSAPGPALHSQFEDLSMTYVIGFRLIFLVASVTLACFLVLLDVSIIATAVPRITTQFHSLGDIGWYASTYNLASSSLQLLTGKLYSYFKIKWTFLVFFSVFELGSLLCGIATSSSMFIIGRAIAGLGSSGILNGGLTMIGLGVPKEKRPLLLGICTGLTQLGLVGGPLIGGALTEYTTWRWCFYINLPIGAIVISMLWFTEVPDTRAKIEGSFLRLLIARLDLAGFVLLAPASIMILLALDWGGNRYSWGSAPLLGLLCGGMVGVIVFALWEKKAGDDAMIPASVISKTQIWSSCLTSAFLFCTVMIASFYFSIYFQAVRNASPFTTGVDMLPSILSQLVFAVVGGFLVQKFGTLLPFAVAGGVALAVANGLITTWSLHTATATWSGHQVLLGAGRGLSTQIPILAVQANTEPNLTAVATSLLVFAQNFSGAVIVAIANAIFQHTFRDKLQSQVPQHVAEAVSNAGAGGIRQITPTEYLPEVLESYLAGVKSVFYIGAAGGCLMIFSSFGLDGNYIRKT